MAGNRSRSQLAVFLLTPYSLSMRKGPARAGARAARRRGRVGGHAAGARARSAPREPRQRPHARHPRLRALTRPPVLLQELPPMTRRRC